MRGTTAAAPSYPARRRASPKLGITRAHIVAHDFGGPWALAWAARHPGVLASATLINTGVLIDYRWHHFAAQAGTEHHCWACWHSSRALAALTLA